ncbi:MAG: hypothetical protein ACKVGZ_09430 [Alphaproteobacteria bacterium]
MARHRHIEGSAALTCDSLETLLDLVEIRLGHVEVHDREDARELRQLQQTRDTLNGILGIEAPPPPRGMQLPLDRMRRAM